MTGGDEAREPRRERHDALDDVGDALEVEEALRGDTREARAERPLRVGDVLGGSADSHEHLRVRRLDHVHLQVRQEVIQQEAREALARRQPPPALVVAAPPELEPRLVQAAARPRTEQRALRLSAGNVCF